MGRAAPRAVAPRRAPLSKEAVLGAAIRLSDNGGTDALSMRTLARELGVEAMSLYHYVKGKDELLAGMTDAVVAEIELPPRDGHWKEALRRTAASAHDVLSRHPWACDLLMTVPSTARLRWMDAVLRTLREAGFSPELTDHAYHTLDSHITGYTLWVASLRLPDEEAMREAAERYRAVVAPYPDLVLHLEQHLKPHKGPGAFAFGLDLILDGIERLRS